MSIYKYDVEGQHYMISHAWTARFAKHYSPGFPAYFLFDKDGKLLARWNNCPSPEEVREKLK